MNHDWYGIEQDHISTQAQESFQAKKRVKNKIKISVFLLSFSFSGHLYHRNQKIREGIPFKSLEHSTLSEKKKKKSDQTQGT